MDSTAELDAMRVVAEALDPLDADARARIIAWAAARYGTRVPSGTVRVDAGAPDASSTRLAEESEYQTAAEFFDAANPQTESEKALIMGYWMQKRQGLSSFDSATINRELKHLGHAIKNITSAFDDLREVKPALAVQMSKSGKSQQARKKYMITGAGEKAVLQMLVAAEEPE